MKKKEEKRKKKKVRKSSFIFFCMDFVLNCMEYVCFPFCCPSSVWVLRKCGNQKG